MYASLNLYMRKETEVGVRPPSARQWTRRAAGACAMHETSHSNPRVDRPPPRPRPHASRRGPQHPHSTSVLLSPDGKPDESKRHGWWHFAATLVQSRWRGWAGRRRYLRHRRAARIIQANYRRWRARCLVRANHPRRFVVQTPPTRVRNENTRTHTSLLPSVSARTQAIARLRAARDAAATRIARAWRRHVPRARYRALRNLARAWSRVLHPSTMLRHSGAPNDAAMTSDIAAQTHVRLALIANGGDGDDAVLVYRVCTHGPVVDVGRRRRRRSREDEETRNPWRPVEDDNGFLRSIVADCAVKKPSNAEIMETYTVRMSRKVPSVEERAAEMKRRARDRRRKVFGLVDNDDDEEAPSDEEDLLAWSASLDFDSFQRTLVT
jgi:hypothetical protein